MPRLPRRDRASRPQVRINRRPQDKLVARAAQEAAEQTAKDQRLNLKIAGLVAILSVPALAVSLLSLYLQVQNENEAGQKEAARVNWSIVWSKDKKKVAGVAIENRSLNPASLTTLIMKDDKGKEVHRYVFDYITPCTREVYTYPPRATEAIEELDAPGTASLYFVDSTGKLWRNDDFAPREIHHDFVANDGINIIKKYEIPYTTEELQACG
ncbi:hypothetical protein ACFYWX_32265 [Streptomyces sp. NPDC002888]|uniref:hypothetical protein n=1 Tax=Streptomyces sp. NPDC002888 TaxID=3364668 RepID=UPI0036C3D49C